MNFSSPSTSHMPNTIFPDTPESRRASTTLPPASDPSRPANTRRYTTAYPPTRPQARPLRSSPLAGPSLALTKDGTLKPKLDTSGTARGLTLVHATSSPDISTKGLLTDMLVQSPINGPASPTDSSGHNQHAVEESIKSSRLKRLSSAFKRRSTQRTARSDDGHDPASLTSRASPSIPVRARTLSSPASPTRAEAPPVPDLPFWARASSQQASASTGNLSLGAELPALTTSKSWKRRSTAPATPPPISPTQLLNLNMPSTSRDPEQNWLSTAAAPRFSRLGLKGEGVVLPVSLKEARRRSTVSLSSRASSDGRNVKGKPSTRSLRSVNSMGSETAKRMAEHVDEIQPPLPPFRAEANASTSSIASSTLGSIAESDSIATESRVISRSSLSTEPDSHLDERPIVRQSPYALESKSSSTMELVLRVNDVTVDIIGFEEQAVVPPSPRPVEVSRMSVDTVPGIASQDDTRTGTPESQGAGDQPRVRRKRTLKQVLRRVVKSVTG